MALVVVLLFLPLLAVLVAAYLGRAGAASQISGGYLSRSVAGLLAKSALEVVVGDLRQELVSAPVPPAVPWRTSSNEVHLNLLKRSAGGEAFHPGGAIRAAAGTENSSTVASRNGRLIQARRWNKSYLLARSEHASPSDTTPVDFTPPDWILISGKSAGLNRLGETLGSAHMAQMSDRLPENGDYVLGRCAYLIYDEGGLLDVNAAGFPSGISAALASRKGTLAFADLGLLGISRGVPNQIDRIVGWRNYATARPGRAVSGNFYSYDFGAFNTVTQKRAAESYFDAVLADKLDPLRVSPGPGFNGCTDQRFLGRQQLLQFRRATGFSDAALQYLGTFSRESNEPSFAPDPNRPRLVGDALHGGNDAFDPADPKADRINPPLLQVRVGKPFIRNDGTTARLGDPLLASRFALSRLGWITFQGPSAEHGGDPAGTAQNIELRFGLRWQPASQEWVYLHGGLRPIARLEEVAQLGRDPDFFELLKAGIVAGSLGKSALRLNQENEYLPNQEQFLGDASLEGQLFQIGANIIDQSDTDSYPTHLRTASGQFHGSEDLPGLYRVFLEAVRTGEEQGAALLEPELWNPYDWHSTPAVRGPTRFRITLEAEEVRFEGPATGEPVGREASALEFDLGLADRASFRQPTLLRDDAGKIQPGAANLTGVLWSPFNTLESGTFAPFDLAAAPSRLVGFRVGSIDPWRQGGSAVLVAGKGLRLRLEYEQNGWHPYQVLYFPSGQPLGLGMAWPFRAGASAKAAVLNDPRTERFGVGWVTTTAYPARAFAPSGQAVSGAGGFLHESMRPDAREEPPGYAALFGLAAQQGWFGDNRFPGCLSQNSASQTSHYADPDGVVRRAMGAYTPHGTSIGLPMAAPVSNADWDNRPFLLNRPFRNVAELGYVFRGSPWKNLDFFTAESGDSALLDLFCVSESKLLVGGRLNPNGRHPKVVEAMLAGSARDASGSALLGADECQRLAQALAGQQQPLGNRAELVRWIALSGSCYGSEGGRQIQRYRETALRSLVDVSSCRLWTLLIDLVVQAGRFPPGSQKLNDFVVEGEQRLWVHLAMDRFTGRVLDRQVEVVSE